MEALEATARAWRLGGRPRAAAGKAQAKGVQDEGAREAEKHAREREEAAAECALREVCGGVW